MAISIKLRRRLRTINSLNSIFNALKVITVARLQKIREQHRQARHFMESFQEMGQDFDFSKLNKCLKKGKTLAILISPNRGFCGGFNNNLFYRTQNFIREKEREIEFVTFGRKGLDYLKKNKQAMVASYPSEDYNFQFFSQLMNRIWQRSNMGEWSEIHLIFNRFRTVMRQDAVADRLLPLETAAHRTPKKYLAEPDREKVTERIFKYRLSAELYFAFLDSQLGELSSRLFTLKGAIENSDELIDQLVLDINKQRQQSVTRELLEIIGATEGQKGEEIF